MSDFEIVHVETSTIGQLVANHRKAKGLTQKQLAAAAGISRSTMQRIEQDSQPQGANLGHLIDIGRALGKRLTLFFIRSPQC